MTGLTARLALAVTLAGAVTAIGLGTSAQATEVNDSRGFTATADPPSAHTLGSTTLTTVVRVYDARGRLVSKRVIRPGDTQRSASTSRDCGLLCHVVGCAASSCPDHGGHARIDVIQVGYSTLGADLWSWDVWTTWSWDHRGCPCTVSLIRKGHVGKALDQYWAYDGIVGKDQCYVAGGGGPHTSYHNGLTAQFEGPSVVPYHHVYRRPTNVLTSYDDGRFEWNEKCC